MQQKNKKFKNLSILVLTLIMCTFMISSAFATLTLIGQDQYYAESLDVQLQDSGVAVEKKTRVPEPHTMLLFGGGFIGMMISFVRKTYFALKRVFDVVGSLLAFMLFGPIMLLVALLVKMTSKGPIIYSQVRVGLGGNHFKIYKFRTMRVGAEAKTGPVWAAKNDSRMTPIGNFLRKSHLDELPQFINVLKGEMSIIGPRPERPVFVDQFKKAIPHYDERLGVKPGITGLAQVWHRYDTDIEDVKKKLRYDLLYIKKLCFWTDFNIILRTFRVVITGEGAH